MTEYRTQDEQYSYPVFDGSADELFSKRKRLSSHEETVHEPASGTNRHDVEIIAWQFLGTIGILLTLGSIVITLIDSSSDGVLLAVPLLYMIAVMAIMRRR